MLWLCPQAMPSRRPTRQSTGPARKAAQAGDMERRVFSIRTFIGCCASLLILTSCASPPGPTEAEQREQLLQKKQRLAELERQIEIEMAAYKMRPHKRFVSVFRAGAYQEYVNICVSKVMAVGNKHYPATARARHYGKGYATISIDTSGQLVSAIIDKSSGHPLLDDAFLRAIRLSAPFPPLPVPSDENVDVLSIITPFTYENADAVSNDDDSAKQP